jgi:outer membrane protein TolC
MSLAWCMIALSLVGADDQEARKPQPPSVVPRTSEVNTGQTQERWPMDLAMATRIAFDNSENFRLVQFGVSSFNGASFFPMDTDGPIRIGRLNADVPVAKFKADAMAFVRSVEQQYWNLAQAEVALGSAEQAVRITRELLKKAQAEITLSRGGLPPDVVEAAERLEQFSGDLTTRRENVVSAERALRKVLGLPPADHRRIFTTTKPAETLLSFDWDTCVDELLQEQPDNVQQQALVRLAELSLLMARYQFIYPFETQTLRQLKGLGSLLGSAQTGPLGKLLTRWGDLTSPMECVEGIDLSGNGYIDSLTWQRGITIQAPMGGGRSPLTNTRQAQYLLLQAEARQRQIFHQTTHSLARFFLEVDANYKQYSTAKRVQAAAAKRVDVQRAYYEEGRITVDRLLNAINQNELAIANESRYKIMYNISLAALSEAKGTLLADRNIVVAEGPKPVRPVQIAPEPRFAINIKPSPFAAPGIETDTALALAKLPSTSMPAVLCATPTTASNPEDSEVWPMSLAEAIRIAIDSSKIIPVVAQANSDVPVAGFEPALLNKDAPCAVPPEGLKANGAPIVIARLNADACAARIKGEVMAHIRSVEQQYWNLARAHIQRWVAEQSVKVARDLIEREEAELQLCARSADVAEAKQRLEQFNLNLVARTSDVITAERQLKNILGLPAADNRRIIPMTPPAEHRVAFDWDACLHEMMQEQPDVAQHTRVTRTAEQQQAVARTTQSLARFFLEVDANYKQYQAATRLRVAAAERLEAQRGYYEEGRSTVDRFLDAFCQYATAVVTEFQYKTDYNVSLAALSEAKGTLLADRGINVSKSARSTDAKPQLTTQAKLDDQTKKASIEQAQDAEAPAKPKTWSFSISIGWDKPLQIKGTISVDEPADSR